MTRISVLIVDDHGVVRQGLRTYLELVEDIEVLGEATNGLEAVAQVRKHQPDVVYRRAGFDLGLEGVGIHWIRLFPAAVDTNTLEKKRSTRNTISN